MLAQSFMTADELHLLSEQHRQALIKTLVMLETGKLKHKPDVSEPWLPTKEGVWFTGHFNMSCWRAIAKCGTVACIGGTAEIIGDVSFDDIHSIEHWQLRDLFLPRAIVNWDKITPTQAARALRSFLTIGEAHWDLAIKQED